MLSFQLYHWICRWRSIGAESSSRTAQALQGFPVR